MLKKFAVENYRGFEKRVELDFTKVGKYSFHSDYIRNSLVNKCMVVGRNGCGKTNFGLALFDIVCVLTDFQTEAKQKDSFGFLNGNSDIPYATFTYVFTHDSGDITYEYRKSSPDFIIFERMDVNGKTIFVRDGDKNDYSGLSEYGVDNLNIDIRDGAFSVLRFIANTINPSKGTVISAVMEFVKGMLYVRSSQDGNTYIGVTRGSEPIQDYIVRNGLVEDFQDNLRYFADLDMDLKILKAEGTPEKLVAITKNKLLDFDYYASSGTRMLMLHYYWIKHLNNVTFLYLDEFDAYYHFKMAERIMMFLSKDPDFQCVFTSHNTSLVSNRLLRPDCYMCMNSRGIRSLPELTDREIREGHSLEKLLRGGEFDE